LVIGHACDARAKGWAIYVNPRQANKDGFTDDFVEKENSI